MIHSRGAKSEEMQYQTDERSWLTIYETTINKVMYGKYRKDKIRRRESNQVAKKDLTRCSWAV